MIDERQVLQELEGGVFSGPELRKELERLLVEHSSDFPVEFGTDDLFALACRNRWIQENDKGQLEVKDRAETSG